jgi:hypothetical protein
MKKSLLAMAVLTVFMGGCSTATKMLSDPGIRSGEQTAISEQRVTQDFKRRGVKVEYSMFFRDIKAIEVTGYAPVWGNSPSATESAYKVAELDAKKKLIDFIWKETVASDTSVNMISKSLERGRDQKTNRIASNYDNQNVSISDIDVEGKPTQAAGSPQNVNVATRNDAVEIATTMNNFIRTNNKGILSGLRLVDNAVLDGGKVVSVVYRWDARHTGDIQDVRRMMSR